MSQKNYGTDTMHKPGPKSHQSLESFDRPSGTDEPSGSGQDTLLQRIQDPPSPLATDGIVKDLEQIVESFREGKVKTV